MENDAIYENLKPASCAVNDTEVPNAEVEAYLNKVIGTAEAGEDFRVSLYSFFGHAVQRLTHLSVAY